MAIRYLSFSCPADRNARPLFPSGTLNAITSATNIISLLCPALHRLRSRFNRHMKSEEHRELLAMLARESYFERQLTLSSGRASNYYVDCKRTLYLPRGAYLAGELVLELVKAAGVEQIGGMAAGALPVTDAAIAAAHRNGVDIRGFFVRKETKQHGLQQMVEGAFKPGLKTAVIDDTITTGGSSLQAVAAMREAGGNVVAAIALVERGEGAVEAFARAGLKYSWVFTAEEVRAERAAHPIG
jgi:orotate phosphoribosyltransferase